MRIIPWRRRRWNADHAVNGDRRPLADAWDHWRSIDWQREQARIDQAGLKAMSSPSGWYRWSTGS